METGGISSGAFIGVLFNLSVSFGIPIAAIIFLAYKKKSAVKPFLIGMLAFFLSQFVLRIPILQIILPQMAWFRNMQNHIWIYALFLGSTAALFEETARWLAMKYFMKDKKEFSHGIAFGLGHGGIEAVLIVGITSINNIIYMAAIQNGGYDLLMQSVPQETAAAIKEQFLSMNFWYASMGGVERISAILFHVAASLFVLKAVKENKMVYYAIAFLLHMFFDFSAVVFSAVFQMNVYLLEAVIMFFAAASFLWALQCWGKRIYLKR